MGISDKKWFRFSCPSCQAQEVDCVTDSGSQWGPPHWSTIGPLKKFAHVEASGPRAEPDVESATCNACGGRATVETRYGFGEPKWT